MPQTTEAAPQIVGAAFAMPSLGPPRSLDVRDRKSVRLARAVLFGPACLVGAFISAWILSLVLGRGLSGFPEFQDVVFGVVPGTFHYFLAPRMRRLQRRIERKFQDQQRRVR